MATKQLKEIFSFNVLRFIEEEVTEETPDGKLTKKVKVEKPLRVILKKPSRAESEANEEVYAIEYGRCVRAGMLTDALIEKLYSNEDGFLAKNDQERYAGQYLKLIEIQEEFQTLKIKVKKTKKDEEKIALLTKEWITIERDLQELQNARNGLFSNTAETKARNKSITDLSLALTYIQEDENKDAVPFYKGNSYDERIKSYDVIVEGEEEYKLKIIDKSTLYISLWYLGKLNDLEDFKDFEATVVNGEDKKIEASED